MKKVTLNPVQILVLSLLFLSPLNPQNPHAADQTTPAEQTCVDGDADGWGWNGEKSCRSLIDPPKKSKATLKPTGPIYNKKFCRNWDEIQFDNYRIMNNTWGRYEVNMGGWSQCIELVQDNKGLIKPKWHFNWLGREDGNEISVKAYPQVYYGRKGSKHISGTQETIGLPRIVEKLDNFKVSYKFSETGKSERNVAFESFFHNNCQVENSNKQYEMMIWVANPNIRKPGKYVGEATVDGSVWDIYTNPILPHPYVAFVSKEDSTSGELNWNKFIDWILTEGHKFSVGKLNPKLCMGAIEFGTEIFWGEGTFTVEKFEVSRS